MYEQRRNLVLARCYRHRSRLMDAQGAYVATQPYPLAGHTPSHAPCRATALVRSARKSWSVHELLAPPVLPNSGRIRQRCSSPLHSHSRHFHPSTCARCSLGQRSGTHKRQSMSWTPPLSLFHASGRTSPSRGMRQSGLWCPV